MKVNVEETQQQMGLALEKTRVLEIQNEILLKQVSLFYIIVFDV